jgi:hypothetical protein
MAGATAISRTYNILETATDPSNIPGLWDVITSNIPTVHYFLDEATMETAPGDKSRFRVYKEEAQATGAGATQDVVATYIDPWTVGEYAFKFIYVPVRLPNQHLILNAGPNKIIDIVKDTMAVMLRTMISTLGGSVRGVWTANSNDETEATKMTGLPSIIKATGNATGTTGRISRTNAFWQNSTTTTAISSFATNGLARYREALMNAKRGTDFPDVGITTTTQFLNYLATFNATVQLHVPISGERFDVGVPDVRLYGLRMFPDDNATADQARFINTEYLKLMLLEGDYLSFSPAMGDIDKDDTVIRLRSTLNLFAPWLAAHAVVTGGDTA